MLPPLLLCVCDKSLFFSGRPPRFASTLPRHWDVFFTHHLRVPPSILKTWVLCLALIFWKENRFRKSLVKDKRLGPTELGLAFGSLCCNSPCFRTYTRV